MNKTETIKKLKRELCTGCGVCQTECPVKAIQMRENEEGFVYPVLDEDLCVHCGRCAGKCPQLKTEEKRPDGQKCYAVMAENQIRRESSSGGAFFLLAEYVLEKGGVVWGAAWRQLEAVHICIESKEMLRRLQKSKYIQSNTKDCFQRIKEQVKERYVLFSGCPCQVAGLRSLIGEGEQERLLTVDIICHGVPSYKALQSYLKEIQKKEDFLKAAENALEIDFRNKDVYGWSTTFQAKSEGTEKEIYRESYEKSNWWEAYRTGLMYRESCYRCRYASKDREGDFTIGDFWGIGEYKKELSDGYGTSLLLLNSVRGREAWQEILKKYAGQIKKFEEVPYEVGERKNSNLKYPSPRNRGRSYFYKKLEERGFEEVLKMAEEKEQGHKDVGILGYWFATNYGSVVTYYALAKAVERLGYSVELIDQPEKEKDAEGLDVFSRRFLEGRVAISESVKWSELERINEMCDTFLVGSDQIWTPGAIRHMGYFFFLKMISDAKKKIAYAPSFGQAEFKALPETKRMVSFLLKKFDAISVREADGVRICRETFHVNAQRVLDPVFLIDKQDYDEIAKNSMACRKQAYLVAYILDPTEDKRKAVTSLSEKLQLPAVILLDGRFNTFEKNREKMNMEGIVENVGVEDWVYYIKHAAYMITDSHHGLAMGIIYHKQLVCYGNPGRGQSRFLSLLSLLEMKDRLVESAQEMQKKQLWKTKTDYGMVDYILAREREASENWLRSALEKDRRKYPSDYEMAVAVMQKEFKKQIMELQKRIVQLEEEVRNGKSQE